jgi:predicted unusual protein kinase regulating ubiquinone biosynthesis (AarF/ABC1/UbiB family)
LAIKMGGVMIKMGQFLSARMDVLPLEITSELAGLQDEVNAEPFEHVRQVIEEEFGCRLEERFDYVEVQPLASASIGQVHKARMHFEPSGEEITESETRSVVVKVQRPNIARIVDIDLSALRVVGRWVELYRPVSKRVDVSALLDEFSRSLHEEIDYLTEGKNAETFAENFADVPDVIVPKVFWSHTTRRVLTLEDVMAIKISDYEKIDAAGINRGEVATRLFNTYLKQIFDDRFFHADPHPGNLFISPGTEKDENGHTRFSLVFIDFGMMGHIPPGTFAGLRELFIGVGTQDASRVIKAYQMLNIIIHGTDTTLLEKAATRVFDRFWGKTAPEVMEMPAEEAQAFIDEFGELLYDMPFQIPENLILFGRCIAILSGICTGLDHNFNVFPNVQPYANKLIGEEGGSGASTILKEIVNYLTMLSTLPRKTEALLKKAELGQLEVRSPVIEARLTYLNRTLQNMTGVIVFATLFISGVQLFLGGYQMSGVICAAAGLLILFIFLLRPRRR